MTSLRFTTIPFEHLLAEVASYPFSSESSLRLAPILLSGDLHNHTGELWRAAENYLLSHFPGFSIDMMVSVRDDTWFSSIDRYSNNRMRQIYLHNYLKLLAERYLDVNGSFAVPKVIGDKHCASGFDGHGSLVARQGWRWLTFALPQDMILASLGTAQRGPEFIELVSPDLDCILRDSGYAESHLHLGAAINFPALWVGLLYQLSNRQLRSDSFRSPGATFNNGIQFGPWLVRAALIRYILAVFLVQSLPQQDFFSFLTTRIKDDIIRDSGITDFILLLQGISELQHGQLSTETNFAQWTGLYALVTRLQSRRFPDELQQLYEIDPIAAFIPHRIYGRATPEMTFIATALEYLTTFDQNNIDSFFAQLFWQVQRIRVLFYQHITQRPMVAGLQWFIRFFGRMKEARRPFRPKIILQSAAQLCGSQSGLRALEVRLGFPESIDDAQQQILALGQCVNEINNNLTLSSKEPIEIGFVYHFNKSRGGGASEGTPKTHWIGSEADPSFILGENPTNPSGFRYARYYIQKKLEAISLGWLIYHFPKTVELIRGLDLCADELGVPNWVFLPLIQYVREAASLAIAKIYQQTGIHLPPLRTTVHAGEDFVHLLTGLRNIDQAIEQFAMREGDRIGHGIALGVDAAQWTHRVGKVAISSEERLFDLVWEWTWYNRGKGVPLKGRHKIIEHEINVLSHKIFQESLSPYSIDRLYHNLYSCERLRQIGFPYNLSSLTPHHNTNTLDSDELLLLYHYLANPNIFHRGREIVWIDLSIETEVLIKLQKELRKKVSSRNITIEINPTSNLLIGDMGDLSSHPLWRLYPPRPDNNLPPVSICIGSDDPIVFASNLREEYQWIFDALTSVGLTDAEIHCWLDRVRRRSLESRFTLPVKNWTIDSVRQFGTFGHWLP